MDIAYYLSELLEQLGEVNVPGLGSFTRVKIDGYYNSDEGRFYPPTSKIEFNQQYIDDDVLARYIGVKKRISLASSKYFTEKYLAGLRQEIMSKEITLADVGSLYFENGQVRFKAAEALPDPAFYGYPKIPLNKLGNEPAYNWDESITSESVPVAEPEREPEPEVEDELMEELPASVLHEEPVHDEQVSHDETVQEQPVKQYEESVTHAEPTKEEPVAEEHHDYFTPQPETAVHTPQAEEDDDFIFHSAPTYEGVAEEEEERPRSYKWLWITLLVLLIAGGGVFAWFYYQQQPGPKPAKKTAPLSSKDTTDSASSASAVKTAPVSDSTAKTKAVATPPVQNSPASTIDSTKSRYEVIGVSEHNLKAANRYVSNYQKEGITTAHILARQDAPGPLYKVSLGTYSTYAQALSVKDSLLKTRKIRKDVEIRTINPKK